MSDFVVALGLVLVIEGLLWAISPNFALRVFEAAKEVPEASLRYAGAAAVCRGFHAGFGLCGDDGHVANSCIGSPAPIFYASYFGPL